MSNVPLHPALVHLPLGLALVLPLVAAGLAWAVWRGRLPRGAFAVVVALQALLVVGGFAAMQAGERDEDRVERIVGEPLLEAHEERAEAFVWTAAVVLAAATAALVLRPRAAAAAMAATVAGTLAVMGLGVLTGKAGGELVYGAGAASAYATPRGAQAAAPADPRGARHRDDD